MQSLSSLSLVNTSIRGPLPDAWAGHFNQAGMSALSELYLGFNDGLAGEAMSPSCESMHL